MAAVPGASESDGKAFGVGEEILIQGRHVGTVKFIGEPYCDSSAGAAATHAFGAHQVPFLVI